MTIRTEKELSRFQLWLKLGILNHIVPLIVIFIGCVESDFTCHGDGMGGVMLLYALVIVVPQIIFECVVFIQFLIAAPTKTQLRETKILISVFVVTLVTAVAAMTINPLVFTGS